MRSLHLPNQRVLTNSLQIYANFSQATVVLHALKSRFEKNPVKAEAPLKPVVDKLLEFLTFENPTQNKHEDLLSKCKVINENK